MNEIEVQRSLMVTKNAVMLEMQDAMNTRVDPHWIDRNREWYRAIWIECAELMDHFGGWKWWKDSHCDVDQVLLEIVDIWHFGLSTRITGARDHPTAAAGISDEWMDPTPSEGFLCDVERLANHVLSERTFPVAMIPTLLGGINRDFDDLYRHYVGKNVLNFFRQDNGYKDGTYIKIWNGREDNEHLVDVLATLDTSDPNYRELVYQALQTRYTPGRG